MVGGGDLENMLVYDDIIGSSLDNFDDILDFSTEETHLLLDQSLAFPWQDLHSHSDQFPPLPTNDKAAPPPPNAAAYAGNDASENTGDFLCDDIDMAQLEWLSNFVEESFSPATIDLPKSVIDQNSMMGTNQNQVMIGGLDKKDHELQYRTPSPVSVLEHTGLINIGSSSSGSTSTYSSSSPTSSSCSGVVSGLKVLAPLSPPETLLVRGRAPRTKRSRPAAAFSRSNQFTTAAASEDVNDEASLFIPVPNSSEHENFAESVTAPAAEFRNVDHSKKKKKPKTFPSAMAEGDESGSGSDTAGGGATQVRKCMHCEITKTPQWRAGPMGPKTLCNACGVRYKSGRLFPEYRPAASPTFVATVHSNSHKKVVEMRNKTITKVEATVPGPVSFKACELLNYIRGKSSSNSSRE